MKKKYVKPSIETIELNAESGFLASSFIEVGGGTDSFEDEEVVIQENMWKWMDETK